MDAKHFYTIAEFAEAMGVVRKTVSLWISHGKIKVIRLGKSKMARVRIPAEELERIKREWVQGGSDED